MNLIIKRASVLSSDEKTLLDISGIPDNWPIESALYVDSVPDGFEQMSDTDLAQLKADNQSAYNSWFQSKMSPSPQEYIKKRILAAMDFGKNMMAQYGATNVLAGRSVADIQTIMASTSKVQAALLTGSLYVALTEIANITPDGTLITQDTLDGFRHQIQDYLGIPRT